MNWLSPRLSADNKQPPSARVQPSTFKTIVSFQFVSHRFISCRTLTQEGLTVSTYTLVINSYLLPSLKHSVGARWPVFLFFFSSLPQRFNHLTMYNLSSFPICQILLQRARFSCFFKDFQEVKTREKVRERWGRRYYFERANAHMEEETAASLGAGL